MRFGRWLAAILGLLAFAAACGGDKPPRSSELTVVESSVVVPTVDPSTSTPVAVDANSTDAPNDAWKDFSAGGVRLSLPARYEGGDLTNDLDVIVERLRRQGSQFKQLADTIQQNPGAFLILATDTSGDYPSAVVVTKERTLSTDTLQSIEAKLERSLPSVFSVIEHEIVTIGRYNAMRVEVRESLGIELIESVYLIKRNNVLFGVAFTSPEQNLVEIQLIIDQSLRTLQLP